MTTKRKWLVEETGEVRAPKVGEHYLPNHYVPQGTDPLFEVLVSQQGRFNKYDSRVILSVKELKQDGQAVNEQETYPHDVLEISKPQVAHSASGTAQANQATANPLPGLGTRSGSDRKKNSIIR